MGIGLLRAGPMGPDLTGLRPLRAGPVEADATDVRLPRRELLRAGLTGVRLVGVERFREDAMVRRTLPDAGLPLGLRAHGFCWSRLE